MHITTRNSLERADLSDSIREDLHHRSSVGREIYIVAMLLLFVSAIVATIS